MKSILDPSFPEGVDILEWLRGVQVGGLIVHAVKIGHGLHPLDDKSLFGSVQDVHIDKDTYRVRDLVIKDAQDKGCSDSFVKGIEDGVDGLWEIAKFV